MLRVGMARERSMGERKNKEIRNRHKNITPVNNWEVQRLSNKQQEYRKGNKDCQGAKLLTTVSASACLSATRCCFLTAAPLSKMQSWVEKIRMLLSSRQSLSLLGFSPLWSRGPPQPHISSGLHLSSMLGSDFCGKLGMWGVGSLSLVFQVVCKHSQGNDFSNKEMRPLCKLKLYEQLTPLA